MSTEKNQNNFKFNPMWLYGIVIALFIGLSFFNGNNFQDPSIISTSKFNDLLAKGKIEKVIIFNKVQAEAYLTAAAL
jgi:cell division protease FtsH